MSTTSGNGTQTLPLQTLNEGSALRADLAACVCVCVFAAVKVVASGWICPGGPANKRSGWAPQPLQWVPLLPAVVDLTLREIALKLMIFNLF